MSELKLPRLLAAAKEFNVGQDTLIDFLSKKGFNKDELKPTAKLTEAMYYSLQAEFQNDKQAKNKADLVEIPKSQQSERRKRDEEEITFRRDDRDRKPQQPKEEVKVDTIPVVQVAPPVVAEVSEPEPSPAPLPTPVVVPVADVFKPIEVAPVEVVIEKITETIVEAPINIISAEHKVSEEPKESTIIKIEAPELEGPKILSKIDLSTIDFSTRPKKATVQKIEEVKPQEPTPEIPKEMPVTIPVAESTSPLIIEEKVIVPVVTIPAFSEPIIKNEEVIPVKIVEAVTVEKVVVASPPQETSPETGVVIENIRAEKITGPKILGKIELPIDSDTRPKPSSSAEDRKKRKRIPVDNRRVGGNHNHPQHNHPQHGGGQQQGQPHHGQPHHGGQPNQSGHGQSHAPANFQNRNHQQGQGGFNRDRTASPYQSPAQDARASRPVVPANNNNSRGGQGGGSFNRDNNRPGGGSNRNSAGSNNRTPGRRDDREIDAKEIQDKIKETQAKLAGGGGRGKSLKAKYRRAKRDEAAEAMNDMDGDDNKLQVTEFVTVSELANLMDVSFAEVIGKCMGLGIMVSINQRLDAEVIELVASEFDYEVEFIGVDDIDEMDEEEEEEDLADSVTRPPIVTIMGHVDHGKTSLLDYIRSANVVAGEAGGITQHIGAYEVTLPDGKAITFLDTPGHEAFTAMRARGAKITDIAVIVVAADDAVMPQTREAISHAQAASVPMIFAVNKMDKDGANPQKIYEQLAGMNILVESWGGKYQSQELAAKKGLNVDLLLEKILLEAELLDVKANPKRDAVGSIIEASLDKGRGYVATILVQNGTLRQGDLMVSGQYYGRVKAMFNERNQRVTEAPPSTPVVILGLNGAPQAGEKFKIYTDESEAKDIATKRAQISREQGLRARKHITLDEIGRRLALGNFKELNIIIKGDVDGSVEALSDSLQKLSNQEIAIRVVHKAVGQISESDVLLAAASDAIVIGFNVRPSSQANKLAENEGVQVKMYSIIYTAIDEIRSAMEGMLEPKVEEKEVATVEVKEVYKFDKATVAGCYVQEGKIKRDHKIRVFRDGILVYPRQEGGFAELGSLKRFKDDMKEVNNGYECGLTVKGFSDLNVGDSIIAYEEEEVKRTL